MELDSDGEYTVVVTSYAADETGSYRLEISQVGQEGSGLGSGFDLVSGTLARRWHDGVGDRLADIDGDGSINAIELSQYLHDRYRFDVKSVNPDEYVRTGGPQSGYQHLVVDRGSIGPYDVIFR